MSALAPLALALALVPAATKGPVAPEVDPASLVELPATTFVMGSLSDELKPYGDTHVWEKPAHEVTLPAFALDRTEVTAGAFARFLTFAGGELHYDEAQPVGRVADGYAPHPGAADEPVRNVSWHAARDYCRWAGKHLPTEAEWERAAAGAEGRTFPWGEQPRTCARAVFWTGSAFCADAPVAVGSRPLGASPEGLHDLAGNVAEWTADRFGRYPDGPVTDPRGPDAGDLRVVRGGGFLDRGRQLATRARSPVAPETRSSAIGFRCAWRVGDDDDGVARGALPETLGVPAPARASPPAAPAPEVVLDGLVQPVGLAALEGGGLCVADAGDGAVRCYAPIPGEAIREVDGFGELADLVAVDDVLYAADRAAGVWRIAADGSVTLVAERAGVFRVVAGDVGVAFASADAVGLIDAADVPLLLADGLDAVSGLDLDNDTLVFSEAGDGDAANARVARVDLRSGALTTVVDGDALGDWLRPVDVAAMPGTGDVAYALVGRTFPRSSVLCRTPLTGGAVSCFDYSPPRTERVRYAAGRVTWATHRGVFTRDLAAPGPYRVLGPWTRASDLLLLGDDVLWTCPLTGRVLRRDAAALSEPASELP